MISALSNTICTFIFTFSTFGVRFCRSHHQLMRHAEIRASNTVAMRALCLMAGCGNTAHTPLLEYMQVSKSGYL